MNTTQSRRGFLAVLSAGAAATMAPAALAATLPLPETAPSALAPTVAATPEADPIFAVIAEHRAAWTRLDEADKLHATLREAADDEGLYAPPKIHLYDFPEREAETLVATADEWHTRFTPTGKMIPAFATSVADIKKSVPKGLTKSQRAYWVRKKKLELKRAEEAMWERIDNSECGRACDAWNAADSALRDITARLVSTPPSTIAGVAAVLKHIADFAGGHDDVFESDNYPAQFMGNVADTLARIDGTQS